MAGFHGIGDVTETFVGLALQVVRVCFEGNATYLFITRSMERSRELLCLLNVFDSSGMGNTYFLTSLEQIQVNLFVEHVCGGSNINIFQYSMVLFCPRSFEENLWLPRSLFVLEGHLLLCTENLGQFGPSENAFSLNYFLLDSCCAIVDVLKMVIETSDGLCITLTLECTSEFPPSEKGNIIQDSSLTKKNASDLLEWKLKWFSRDGLSNFVALLKALHSEATLSPLPVEYAS